jgi:hypothetical protein
MKGILMKSNPILFCMLIALAMNSNLIYPAQCPKKLNAGSFLFLEQSIGNSEKARDKEKFAQLCKENQRKNELFVPLWDSGTITTTPKTSEKIRLSANVDENEATALVVQYSSKNQYAAMTHYHSLSFIEHTTAIENLCKALVPTHNQDQHITSINFFVTMLRDSSSTSINQENLARALLLQKMVNDKLSPIESIQCYLIPHDSSSTAPDAPERDFEVTLSSKTATIVSNNGRNGFYEIVSIPEGKVELIHYKEKMRMNFTFLDEFDAQDPLS